MTQDLVDDADTYDGVTIVLEGTRMRLQQEIRRRRMSEVEFSKRSGVSHTWLRRILAGEHAGPGARAKIRAALAVCTVCKCEMEVPPDDVLFAKASKKRKVRKAA